MNARRPSSNSDNGNLLARGPVTNAASFVNAVAPKAGELLELSGTMARYLRGSLQFVYSHAELWRQNGKPPNRSQTIRSLQAIDAAAGRLLATLRAARSKAMIDPRANQAIALLTWSYGKAVAPGHPEFAIQHGRADNLLEAQESALEYMIREARAAADAEKERVRPVQGGDRRVSDRARDEVLDFLSQIYTEVTGTQPTASASAYADGGADSRFIRFARICFLELGWRDSTLAIRERHRRLLARRAASPS